MIDSVPPLIPPMVYAGAFQTRNTIYTGTGAGIFLVMKADPRRIFVEFQSLDGIATALTIYPGPIPNGFLGVAQNNLPLQYKFHDCPSIVQGEFYGAVDLGLRVFISECLYVEG